MRIVGIALLVSCVLVGDARAQSCLSDEYWDGYQCVRYAAPAVQMGHFPKLAIGVGGGFATSDDPDDDEYSELGGVLGVELQTFALTGVGLVHVEAVGNPFGDPLWQGHGRLVLTRGLGGRSSHKVKEVIPATETSPGSSTTWNFLRVPMVYGLAIGGGAFGMEEGVMGSVDAGFALISPQFELSLAAAYDVTHGATGLRWAGLWTLPIRKRLLSMRLRAEHFFGEDADLGTMLVFMIGFTTSIGVDAVR